jgi:hypothetical protein
MFPIDLNNPAQANWPPVVNENLDAISHIAVYAYNYQTSTGLTWGYHGGRWGGFSVADGTLTLTNAATNYIVVARSDGVISFSTSNTNWNDTVNYARVYQLTTAGSVVTATQDHRSGLYGVHGQGANPAAVGTVTSVDASGGVQTASGSAITTSGTIRAAEVVNAQTGTTYTIVTGDRGKLLTLSNASSIAVTLPQAGVSFPDGWFVDVKCVGAGTATITPTTSTIDGAASTALSTGQSARIVSDGTNYRTVLTGGALGAVATDAIWDAAGDLVQGTGANTGARLPIGTAHQIVRANSGPTANAYTDDTLTSSPSFSATPTLDTTGAEVIYFNALTANVTSFNLSGARAKVIVCFVQDGTGGRTVTAGTSIDFGSEITDLSGIHAAASAYTYVGFVYNPTTTKFRVVAISK